MSRFTMALAAAAAAAVAAIAAVALPAVGADPKPSRQRVDHAPDVAAFASCLRSHGLADAPTDPLELKPWLAARERSDPDTVKAAMLACDDKLPAKPPVVARGPDIKDIVNCARSHGLDAPTAPDAFKRWLADKEASDSAAVDTVMRACKMALDPGPSNDQAKPGSCGDDVRPADEAAKRGADDAAKSGADEAAKSGT